MSANHIIVVSAIGNDGPLYGQCYSAVSSLLLPPPCCCCSVLCGVGSVLLLWRVRGKPIFMFGAAAVILLSHDCCCLLRGDVEIFFIMGHFQQQSAAHAEKNLSARSHALWELAPDSY